MDSHGYQWISVDSHGYSLISMDIQKRCAHTLRHRAVHIEVEKLLCKFTLFKNCLLQPVDRCDQRNKNDFPVNMSSQDIFLRFGNPGLKNGLLAFHFHINLCLFGVPGLSLASLDAFGKPELKKVRFVYDFGCRFDAKGHPAEARERQSPPKERPKECQ